MKSNKILNKRYKPILNIGNYFDWGGSSKKYWEEAAKPTNIGSSATSALNGLQSLIGGFTNASQVANTDSILDDINSVRDTNIVGGNFDYLSNQAKTFQPLVTPNYNELVPSTGKQLGNMATSIASGAATGATLGGPFGAVIGGAAGLLSSGAGWITGAINAKKEVNELRDRALLAEQARLNNFNNAVNSTKLDQLRGLEQGYYACGGKMKKRAYGGNLIGDFTNDVTIIGNGGIHETNPYEGVPMGVDSQGVPNLVEEGELIYKDYVYSNRLTLDKDMRDKYHIKNKKATYADVAKKLQKESEERPNDYISKNGLDAVMLDLAVSQEKVRAIKESNKNSKSNKFEYGGDKDPYEIVMGFPENGYIPYNDVIVTIPYEAPLNNNVRTINMNTIGKKSSESNDNPSSSVVYSDLLRYAPAIGAGLNTISDLLGWTNTPDYTNANKVRTAADNLTPIGYTPLHNYLRYEPINKDYYTNKLESMSGAARRNIVNTSGGNRANAIASLLAADYNTQTKLGDLAKSIEEANLARQQQVAAFNRDTDQANSELAMRAAAANSELDKLRLNSILQEVQLRDTELARASAGRTANLNSFLTNLGNIGIDITNRNDMKWMAEKGLLGHYSIEDYMRLGFDRAKATELHNKYYKNLKED